MQLIPRLSPFLSFSFSRWLFATNRAVRELALGKTKKHPAQARLFDNSISKNIKTSLLLTVLFWAAIVGLWVFLMIQFFQNLIANGIR